jgi:hypothetical protein
MMASSVHHADNAGRNDTLKWSIDKGGSNALTRSIDRILLEEEQPVLDRMLQNTTRHAPAEQCMSFNIGINSKNILRA